MSEKTVGHTPIVEKLLAKAPHELGENLHEQAAYVISELLEALDRKSVV